MTNDTDLRITRLVPSEPGSAPPLSEIIRWVVGFMLQTPHQAGGIRVLPPISVPIPRTEPLRAKMAPSPLVDPPGLRFGSIGCVVIP